MFNTEAIHFLIKLKCTFPYVSRTRLTENTDKYTNSVHAENDNIVYSTVFHCLSGGIFLEAKKAYDFSCSRLYLPSKQKQTVYRYRMKPDRMWQINRTLLSRINILLPDYTNKTTCFLLMFFKQFTIAKKNFNLETSLYYMQ